MLISFAKKEEETKLKADLEKRLFPLWLSSYVLSKVKGTECMEYDDFIKSAFSNDEIITSSDVIEHTGDDILAEFTPIINADRERRKHNG